jgi:signal transduction histidine kinase
MITTSLFILSSFLTVATSLLVAIFVSFNWKLKQNRLWFFTAICIGTWSLALAMEVSSSNSGTAMFWNKILNLAAILIPAFFYHFIVEFLKKDGKEKYLVGLAYALSVFFLCANFFTNLLVKAVPPLAGFNYWAEAGALYYPFFVFFAFFMGRIAYLLMVYRRRYPLRSVERQQVSYFLIAVIFGAGGGITNFFPQLGFNIFPFGNFLVALYAIFITYAILKHHLFNIKIVATELLTFTIWFFLFAQIFFAESLLVQLINVGVLILAIVFGILLIKSVIREVEQREHIEKIEKEIERALAVEKKANDELEKLADIKNQFLMTIQHHLRTPLTAMRGYADLLLDGSFGKVPPKIKDVVQKFEDSTVGLIKMVNDFLDITQFQMGKQVITLKEGVNLSETLDEIVKDQELTVGQKGLFMKLDRVENCIIKADESKLKAALVNILDNSVKYTKEGGINISLKIEGNLAKIQIKDNGMGIAKERLAKLFDSAFQRTDEAKKTFSSGRGIGLYLSSQIVQAHKGKIWAESEGEGKGSTFFIDLPIK